LHCADNAVCRRALIFSFSEKRYLIAREKKESFSGRTASWPVAYFFVPGMAYPLMALPETVRLLHLF